MKKTGEEWVAVLTKYDPTFKVLDFDGWDRSNFDYSYRQEQIDADEFIHRLFFCTVSRGMSTSDLRAILNGTKN